MVNSENRLGISSTRDSTVTFLKHMTLATLHLDGETVMEDSLPELRKHLPIWMHAEGRYWSPGLAWAVLYARSSQSRRLTRLTWWRSTSTSCA